MSIMFGQKEKGFVVKLFSLNFDEKLTNFGFGLFEALYRLGFILR